MDVFVSQIDEDIVDCCCVGVICWDCCWVICWCWFCAILFDDDVVMGDVELWGCPHVNKFTIDFFFLIVVDDVGVPCWFDDCDVCWQDCCVISFFTPWIESGVEVVVDKNV